MNCQICDQVLPLLQLLSQPAFCLRADGSAVGNRSAQALMPASQQALPAWLGPSYSLYEQWNRDSDLEFPVNLSGAGFTLTLRALADGTLFLLAPCDLPAPADAALAVAAQVLRQPLTELSAQLQLLAARAVSPEAQAQSAAIARKLCVLTRLTGNLSDLTRLRNPAFRPHMELLELHTWITPLLEELRDLCREAGRELQFRLPQNALLFQADPVLLERGILNLLSNAIKFSPPDTPIVCAVSLWKQHLRLQMTNSCTDGGAELLRGAFTRLQQRDLLPDPHWGMGLGLPLTQEIARLHGGLVTVEVSREGLACVTLAIVQKRPSTPTLASHPTLEYTGGIRRTLVELAELLPNQCFHPDA